MNVGEHQMLQFDWSILVTCENLIRGSGIMAHIWTCIPIFWRVRTKIKLFEDIYNLLHHIIPLTIVDAIPY